MQSDVAVKCISPPDEAAILLLLYFGGYGHQDKVYFRREEAIAAVR